MSPRRGDGCVGIPCLDRRNDLEMFLVRGLCASGIAKIGAWNQHQAVPERIEGHDEITVPRRTLDRLVKRVVETGKVGSVFDIFFLLADDHPHQLNFGLGGIYRSKASGGALQQFAHVIEFGDHLMIKFGDLQAFLGGGGENAFAFQTAQSFSDGRAADVELAGDVSFTQSATGNELALTDGFANLLIYAFGRRLV